MAIQFSLKRALVSLSLICAGLGVFSLLFLGPELHGERVVFFVGMSEWLGAALLISAGLGMPFGHWKLGALLGTLIAISLTAWWSR